MNRLSIHLPDSAHQRVKAWSQKDNISINQFIATAVSEKLAAVSTLEYIEERAARGQSDKFLSVLNRVPDVAAAKEDRF